MSVRSLAEAAGVAASTVHRIERGELQPTTDTLSRLVEAAGSWLQLDAQVDYAVSIAGLARSVRSNVEAGDYGSVVRKSAELVSRFTSGDDAVRRRTIAARPQGTGDERWDAFLAGLAEWLAVRGRQPAPGWVHSKDRYLRYGWWVTPMASMRAWEYAGSPVSFQMRGVYIHRDSLVNV